jgi:NADPH:quinone reductase-like Zn-dependent oxidoreductase
MKRYILAKSPGSSDKGFRLERQDDAAAPAPGPGEVLVRVRATSLNYRDLLIKSGDTGVTAEELTPLSDGAGEVTAIGKGVTRFAVGDRVAAIFFQEWVSGRFDTRYHRSALGGAVPGMLSEYVTLSENGLVRIPDYLSFEEAAALPCAGVTVWQALMARGGFQPGDTVLALGTGGVSILGLQVAKAHGANVLITSSSDTKLARAKEIGAGETINYRATPDWDKEVWRLTEKRGVDHVLEVGGSGTLEKSLNSVSGGGHIALIGVLTGVGPAPSLFPLVSRNARIEGIYVGSRDHFDELNRFLEKHAIHPVIDRVFPFAEANAAYEYLASGAHFGKVVIAI